MADRPYPLRSPCPGSLARRGAARPDRRRQERPSRRASFLHLVRYPRARRPHIAAPAREISGRDDDRAAAPVLGSDRDARRASRSACRSTACRNVSAVPFDAIKGFFDPSVQFGLQFEVAAKEDARPATEPAAATPLPAAERDRAPPPVAEPGRSRRKLPRRPPPSPAVGRRRRHAKPEENRGDRPDRPSGGGEVVRLDRFRKK